MYRKHLMACVLTVFPFFYWRVLMAYVFSDYSGTVKCKISDALNETKLPSSKNIEFEIKLFQILAFKQLCFLFYLKILI